jgi:SAM-dependent methyltransferase
MEKKGNALFNAIQVTMRLLGQVKYRAKNQIREWMFGKEEQYNYDLRHILSIVRTAYYNPKPIGFKTRVMLTERVVEYPFVFQAVPKDPTTILDIGSGDSPLPYHLASLGHQVYTVDVLPYPLTHPNLHSHQCDALRLPFADETFPIAIAISSLEHFGLGGYGDPVVPDAPFQAKEAILKATKSRGRIIVTLPVGKEMDPEKSRRTNYWVFTESLLNRFMARTGIVDKKFFTVRDHHWLPCSQNDAMRVDAYAKGVSAIAALILEKHE